MNLHLYQYEHINPTKWMNGTLMDDDEDVLTDYEEMNVYGTDPLNQDTYGTP
jgi:hypothetical protein